MEPRIDLLQAHDVEEAKRIFNVAFGTFFGAPDPAAFFGDRDFVTPRWRSGAPVLAARIADRLIGSNVITCWGSFGFFGPLTILPEFWDQGVAQRLLAKTMDVFEQSGVRHSGLYTFPTSPKHIGLYQKFGYWPRYLTAIMTKAPEPVQSFEPPLIDENAIRALTNQIYPGLDLTTELRAGHIVASPDAFALCRTGAGTEGGSKLCYVKFGAARDGASFDRLLAACEAFAASRGLPLEAGVNLAREDAYRRMRARGYRTQAHGIAMQRPHEQAFNRPDVYVIDDWR
jgi:GNAT superfamily N-acetyltransferase